MKVRRQNLTEEYNTTAGWVRDFSGNLAKKADYLSNLRSIMKRRNDFDTIEEKMADLKTRVGFDLLKVNVSADLAPKKQAACSCESCDTCSSGGKKNSPNDSEQLKMILKYITSFCKDRPDAGYGAVITHCREHPELGFDRLERKLNNNFEKAVRSILSKHKKDPEAVEYISGADVVSSHDDDLADYYSHANG